MTDSTTPAPRPDVRAEILIAARNEKMARSQHAYVRGSTVKFYEWLEASRSKMPGGPSIWICGDCHVGNLGPLADAQGRVDIQIRDLDQTVIGNPAHDLIRLGLSLASAARGSDLPGVTTARMLEQITEGYEEALLGDANLKVQPSERPDVVNKVLKRAMNRKWKHLARERLENLKPSLPLGKHFWPLAKEERDALHDLFAGEDVRALLTKLKGRDGTDEIEVIDAAYWKKGCSSLGRLRYAVLVGVGSGEAEDRLCLIDVKEGVKAAAPRDPDADMPRDNAQRVVAGARSLSPNLGDRMIAARLLDKAVVVRELLPQDLKIEIDALSSADAMSVARYLAGVVGKAHARQMDAVAQGRWLAELAQSRSKAIDAPSWLWTSVVDLVATHEAAYLEHCRRYALASAA
jgi:uncharacterized protein (DUF2252 family)